MKNHIVMIEDMLRPCPFCGALVRLHNVAESAYHRIITIKCPRCRVEVTMEQDFVISSTDRVAVNENPINTWNRRADDVRQLRNNKTIR